jgi:hypothetical protein
VKVPATVAVNPIRVVALKFTILDPPLCLTVIVYTCSGWYVAGKPVTTSVPPVPPWHDDAHVDLPGALE